MFKTIIWATDASDLADLALLVAEDLARNDRSRIVALHVTQGSHGGLLDVPSASEDPDTVSKLAKQIHGLRARGIDAEVVLRASVGEDVAHVIAEATRELDGDLIVLGTHGRGPLASVVRGSVAKQLIHLASCAVLAVPWNSDLPAEPAARRGASQSAPASSRSPQDVYSL